MAARAEGFTLPVAVLRWIMAPAIGTALFVALRALLRERAARVTVRRVSDEWLAAHERQTHDTD